MPLKVSRPPRSSSAADAGQIAGEENIEGSIANIGSLESDVAADVGQGHGQAEDQLVVAANVPPEV